MQRGLRTSPGPTFLSDLPPHPREMPLSALARGLLLSWGGTGIGGGRYVELRRTAAPAPERARPLPQDGRPEAGNPEGLPLGDREREGQSSLRQAGAAHLPALRSGRAHAAPPGPTRRRP